MTTMSVALLVFIGIFVAVAIVLTADDKLIHGK